MTFIFALGTLGLLGLMYWGAYLNGKEIKTLEISGNLLLSFPEFFFKLVLFGLCLGLASSLDVKRASSYFGWPPKDTGAEIIIGIGLGLVLQFGINIASGIAIRIWGAEIYSSVVIKNVIPKKPIDWLLIQIPLLLAVVVEELLFRALAIGGFSIIINPWILAIASSLLFGLVHAPQGTLGMFLSGIVGFLLAALFIVSNSLLLVITTHFALNLLQILRAKEDEEWLKRFQKQASAKLKAKHATDAASTNKD